MGNFSAALCRGDCASVELLPIKYIREGQYGVQVLLQDLGSYSVSVSLDGFPIGDFQNVPVKAICPPDEFASDNECHTCPKGSTVCAQGDARAGSATEVTLATLDVLPGHWRLSNLTAKMYACPRANKTTPCAGGVGPDYCSNTTDGPLCASCLQPSSETQRRHFDRQRADCLDCKYTEVSAVAVLFLVLLVTAGMIGMFLAFAFYRKPAWWEWLLYVKKTWQQLGITSKLKLLLAYFQVMTLMPEICDQRVSNRHTRR